MARDLEGWRVVVTRAEGPEGALARRLRDAGAEALLLPTVEVGPPEDARHLDEACRDLDRFDWIVFTSARAVGPVAERTAGRRWPSVASVGSATSSAVRAAGREVTVEGPGDGAAALAERMIGAGPVHGRHILFPASDRARAELPERLRAAGATVDQVVAYETRTRTLSDEEREIARSADVVTFTSPSAVDGWCASFGSGEAHEWPAGVRYVAIGATTASRLRDEGLDGVTAAQTTFEGLVDAVRELKSRKPRRG